MRYLIFGAARSGLAAARLLKSKGHDIVLADEKPESALQSAIEQMAPLGVLCRFGAPAAEEWLEGMDYLLISPGVPQTHP
ncbi:MAG TPA: UDP-N-acetylmuramoyl-L-alanine--D-glutamate ligase, partial [Candidatus Sumerlaeia bacterium]|nr:UDP-N-acetylmuramoyl-L-alanine--D-glutamate ligase [Candidatus Sumerlaeia bacterium]